MGQGPNECVLDAVVEGDAQDGSGQEGDDQGDEQVPTVGDPADEAEEHVPEAAPEQPGDGQDGAELDGDGVGVDRLEPGAALRVGEAEQARGTSRCPVEEMGRYSVMPSTTPRIAACHQDSRSSVDSAAARPSDAACTGAARATSAPPATRVRKPRIDRRRRDTAGHPNQDRSAPFPLSGAGCRCSPARPAAPWRWWPWCRPPAPRRGSGCGTSSPRAGRVGRRGRQVRLGERRVDADAVGLHHVGQAVGVDELVHRRPGIEEEDGTAVDVALDVRPHGRVVAEVDRGDAAHGRGR